MMWGRENGGDGVRPVRQGPCCKRSTLSKPSGQGVRYQGLQCSLWWALSQQYQRFKPRRSPFLQRSRLPTAGKFTSRAWYEARTCAVAASMLTHQIFLDLVCGLPLILWPIKSGEGGQRIFFAPLLSSSTRWLCQQRRMKRGEEGKERGAVQGRTHWPSLLLGVARLVAYHIRFVSCVDTASSGIVIVVWRNRRHRTGHDARRKVGQLGDGISAGKGRGQRHRQQRSW